MSSPADFECELIAPPTATLSAPSKYLVATHFRTDKTVEQLYDLLNVYLPYKRAAFRAATDAVAVVDVEVWIVGDFARLRVHVCRDAEGLVIEFTKSKGSGTLVSRMFQQVKALMASESPVEEVTATPSLQPYRPPSDPTQTLLQDNFDRTIATIVTHLEKPAYDLVLHAAQYFAVLADQALTAKHCASSVAVIAGLLSVLDPARKLPIECRTSAAQALLIMCTGSGCADLVAIGTPLQLVERLVHWRSYVPEAYETQMLRRNCDAILVKLAVA